MPFDSAKISPDWDEPDLHSWMTSILNDTGWGNHQNDKFRYKQEPKSSGYDRVDIALFVKDQSDHERIGACIELINPREKDLTHPRDIEDAIRKTSKYAVSRIMEIHGICIYPLAIVSNGHHVIVFDSSKNQDYAIKYHQKYDLSIETEKSEFIKYISTNEFDACYGFSKHPILQKPIGVNKNIKIDESYAGKKGKLITGEDKLSESLIDIYNLCKNDYRMSKESAFISTITLFLVAILRDCGLYPNRQIQKLLKRGDMDAWQSLIDGLEKILHTDLSSLRKKNCEKAWDYYKETSWMNVNLCTFYPSGLGKAYENLLRLVSKETDTIFYTPYDLILDIRNNISFSKCDTILDPTCGSGAFLAAFVEKCFKEFKELDHDAYLKATRKYIESKIFGVDRDWFACQIAKTTLAAIYAKNIHYRYEDENKFKAPKCNIEKIDFFDYPEENKFDVIVGNPPWGLIDQKLTNRHYRIISSYDSYDLRTDVCIYIVEKAWRHLKDSGRFAFVCKRDILKRGRHIRHQELWKGKVEQIWDYGRKHLFKGNSALSMVMIGNKETPNCYKLQNRDKSIVLFEHDYIGSTITSLFDCFKGFGTDSIEIWRELAKKFPTFKNAKFEASDCYLKPFRFEKSKKIFFMKRNEKWDEKVLQYLKETIQTKKLKYSKYRIIPEGFLLPDKTVKASLYWFLENRSDCLQSGHYNGWGRIYRNNMVSNSIAIPQYVRGDRIRAAILTKKYVPINNLTLIYPRMKSKKDLHYTLAFLNTKIACSILKTTCPILDGEKYSALPEKIKQIKIPEADQEVKDFISNSVSNLLPHKNKDYIVEAYLKFFDEIFEAIILHGTAVKLKDFTKHIDILRKIV